MSILTNETATFDPNDLCPSWCRKRGEHMPVRVDEGDVHQSQAVVLPLNDQGESVMLERTVFTPGPEQDVHPRETVPQMWIAMVGGTFVPVDASTMRMLAAALTHYADEAGSGRLTGLGGT